MLCNASKWLGTIIMWGACGDFNFIQLVAGKMYFKIWMVKMCASVYKEAYRSAVSLGLISQWTQKINWTYARYLGEITYMK